MREELDRLYEALKTSWGADTSADPGWNEDCPSLGQCAVSALVVQDYFGGVLMRGLVEGQSHYWNQLCEADEVYDKGLEVDFTRDQFVNKNAVEPVVREREYVLSFPETKKRYDILRERVSEIYEA